MNSEADRVVLIHGLWMHGVVMKYLGRQLAKAGLRCESVSYRTVVRGLDENMARLIACINSIKEPVHIVGHSLGGVLALHTLHRYRPAKIGRVVCLGSPLVGSAPARELARHAWGRKIIGKTLTEGVLEQSLLAVPHEYEVGVVAGNSPWGLGSLVADIEKPHDGMVSVAETKLEGLADHITLPVGHTRMLFSQQVAGHTRSFLKTGRFSG